MIPESADAPSGPGSLPDPPPRLRVGVIGVGRAGAALGGALRRAGHPVVAAHAISDVSRLRAEALLPGTPVVTIPEVFAAADLVLVTVPDDVLVDLVAGCVAARSVRPGQLIMHASGRYGVQALDAATGIGAQPLALHPAMTLTGTSVDLQRLDGCPFAVTSADQVRPIAEALVVEMGGEPIWVPEAARARYHAALAHGSNHLVTLVVDAIDLLRSSGVGEPERLIAPLLSASLDNVLGSGDAALTGPVSRGDTTTVAAHLDSLATADVGVRDSYRAMARRTAQRARASGRLNPEQATMMMALLDGFEEPEGA